MHAMHAKSILGTTFQSLTHLRRQDAADHVKFVVTGLPRSGTRFMATVLSQAHLSCGHEAIFDVPSPNWETGLLHVFDFNLRRFQGDASWMAVPYLNQLAPQVSVLHQVRNPVHVIRSLMGIGFFARTGMHPLRGYCDFALQHLVCLPDDMLEKCMAFWCQWNQRIEHHNHDRYYRYRVEDITMDHNNTLQQIAALVPGARVVDLQTALGQCPTGINHRKRDHAITWDSLPEGALKHRVSVLAAHYGYSFEELECA